MHHFVQIYKQIFVSDYDINLLILRNACEIHCSKPVQSVMNIKKNIKFVYSPTNNTTIMKIYVIQYL